MATWETLTLYNRCRISF